MIKTMGFDPSIYFEKPKPVAILSNTLNENLIHQGNEIYQDKKYVKHLLTKPAILDRLLEHSEGIRESFGEYNTSLESIEGLNLRKAV